MIKIKISIIVPVYKVENSIERCVTSILNQTYKNLELILVNDGSPDKSGEICDKFAVIDERIKVIHKKNGGVSSARNAGLKAAQGDFIAFVDSDDWIEQDMFSTLLDLIQKNNADLAICSYYMEDSDGENVALNFTGLGNEMFSSETALEFVISNLSMGGIWNKIYKREVIFSDNLNFDENITIGEDFLFLVKCVFNSERVVFDSNPKYHYVLTEGSAMNSSFKMHKLTVIDAHLQIKELLQGKYPDLVPTINNRLVSSCINLVITMISSNQLDKHLMKEPRSYIMKGLKEYLKGEDSIKKKLYAVLISLSPRTFRFLWCRLRKI